MILNVGDEQAAVPVEEAIIGFPQGCFRRRAAAAARSRRSGSGNGRNHAARRIHLADDGIQAVHNVQVAIVRDVQGIGLVQGRPRGGSAVAAITEFAGPGDGVDHAGVAVNSAHAVIHRFRHIQVTLPVKGAHEGFVESGRTGRAAVAVVSGLPDACRRRDHAVFKCHMTSFLGAVSDYCCIKASVHCRNCLRTLTSIRVWFTVAAIKTHTHSKRQRALSTHC